MSIGRHTTYNLIGGLLPVFVSLISVPLYLHLIGEERYGVLAIAWTLLGYFSLFDLGLSKATAQRIAAGTGEQEDTAVTFWSALVVNVAMGIVGGIILFFAAQLAFIHYLKVSPDLRPEIAASVPYLAAAVPIATIGGVLTGALIGRQRFLETNTISAASTVLSQLAPIAVALVFGVQLTALIATALVVRFAALLLLHHQCTRHVTRGADVRFSPAEAWRLLKFGGWVTVSAFVGPLMTVLDRFVIGALQGAVAVAVYTVPWQLAQRLLLLPGSLQLALFPRQAAANSKDQIRLTRAGIRTVAIVTAPLVVGGVFLMDPFLKLWIGGDFHVMASEVGRIALFGFWANGVAYVPFAQIEARGHARRAAVVHLLELPFYLISLFVLMRAFGLAGAAGAFALRCAADAVVFNTICLGRFAAWREPLVLGGLLLMALLCADIFPTFGWAWFLSFGAMLAIVCAGCWMFAPSELSAVVRHNMSRMNPALRLP
ncbi:flippase [Sphingomonas segetis]|uniref:flippase n=1 Tax=Sphingomonas segetis TaxID=1104779 RepID=UPI0018AD37A2|nr:flippase [Sphingomonas segetis]